MANQRGVMFQCFHWYIPNDGQHWNSIAQKAPLLKEAGFTSIWLPPAYKSAGGSYDSGYGIYDAYDLGEFEQKGSVRTKYGTKEEYLHAIQTLQKEGLQVYADIILNHRMGGDETEVFSASLVAKNDRTKELGQAEIEGYTKFNFDGRNNTYSSFKWNKNHFNAIDHNVREPERKDVIYRIENKPPNDYVDLEYGNYDYLMGCDIDHTVEAVQKELSDWGKWYFSVTKVDGLRLDAIKHISSWAYTKWLDEMRTYAQKNLFVVGEYWSGDCSVLQNYLKLVDYRMCLFDVPLIFHLRKASSSNGDYDMRNIFKNTLVESLPDYAVTFVANHDSQPLQALEAVIEPWFVPMAYALILLRPQGYPCFFYADYYGATYTGKGHDGNDYQIEMQSFKTIIDIFIKLRQKFTFGKQIDYLDHPDLIGWSFLSDENQDNSMVVLLTNRDGGNKEMQSGQGDTTFKDITGNIQNMVTTNSDGIGIFQCNGGSISVWIPIDVQL